MGKTVPEGRRVVGGLKGGDVSASVVAVGDEDDDLGARLRVPQQVQGFAQGVADDRGASVDVREAQTIEDPHHGPVVQGQRKLGVGLFAKHHHADAVVSARLDEASEDAHRRVEARGWLLAPGLQPPQVVIPYVHGAHGAGHVQGHDDVEALDVQLVGIEGLRASHAHDAQRQGHHAQGEGSASEASGQAAGQASEGGGGAHPHRGDALALSASDGPRQQGDGGQGQ